MKPTNESKMQLQLIAAVLLLTVGMAFGGQWIFNKCFKKDVQEKSKVEIEDVADSLRMRTVYDVAQKQK